MAEDLEEKVERAMPNEDGEDAKGEKQQTSFVSAESEQKGPSMADVFLYMAKKLKNIDEKLGVIVEGKESFVPLKKKVEVKAQKKKKTPKPTPQSIEPIENLKMMFPEDLENLLAFSEKENYIMIKPRQFLGSDNFAKIGAIIRVVGGDYVSAGKDSHFRVEMSKLGEIKPAEKPKQQPEIAGEPPKLVEIKKALGDFLDLVSIDAAKSTTLYLLKPKQFLGSDNFSKIAAIIRNLGGNYVSQGKESHFNVPKNG